MRFEPASMDPLYGPVTRAYGRFRLRRRFIPLRDFQALPTDSSEITVLDEAGTEVAVVWIAGQGDDLPAVVQHLKQWLPGEAARLVHREVDTRRWRREAPAVGSAGETPVAGPWDWTPEQWDAFDARQQERIRPLVDAFEPRVREQDGRSPERTREYIERRIREVGEEPDPAAHVTPWRRLSPDEVYQRYDLVERGLHELEAADAELGELGTTRNDDASTPSER